MRAIELYAEDYVTKPFSYAELAARLARVLKRAWPAGLPSSTSQIDADLVLDFATPAVRVKGESRRLSPTETRLLWLPVHECGEGAPERANPRPGLVRRRG